MFQMAIRPSFSLADLIFVTNITNIISGEKIVMWRNFSFPCMTIVGKLKISPHVEKFQMSPHDRCREIWNSPHMACVWCRKRCHICKIYAVFLKKSVLWKFTHFDAKFILLQFLHFCVEKNLSKNFLCGEKMTNITSQNGRFHIGLP